MLTELLNNQVALINLQDLPGINESQISHLEDQLRWPKKNLIHILAVEELNQLCQAQEELVKLEIQLEQ